MSVKEQIWNFLKEQGFSDEQTAGIMGNIQQESGFNSSAENSIGAYGLFQWLDGRRDNLENYAKSQGTKASDVQTQLEFLMKELKGSESATLAAMQEEGLTVKEYAEIFEEKFERSGGDAMSNRISYAEEIYEEFKGTAATGSSSSGSTAGNTSGGYGLKWWGDLVRVVFCIALIVGAVAFVGLAVTTSAGGESND